MNERFLERIRRAPLVFDGAMGTMLYAKGAFVNTCYDELNLVQPDLVRSIHAAYLDAGAEAIETNSYGANRVKLRAHGLAARMAEINRAAARLAREAAGPDRFVAGAIGPCMRPRQLWQESYAGEFGAAFEEQALALAEGGADAIYLETFDHLHELQLAAHSVRSAGLPVFASFTVSPQGETVVGRDLEAVVDALDRDPCVDGIGINCGVGPQLACDALERALPRTGKPFVVMPNAGMPKEVDGRMMYMTSPEYFATYARRYVEMGARGIGGCCGTEPRHIREAARAIRGLPGARGTVAVSAPAAAPVPAAAARAPSAGKSRLAAKMARGEKVTSIEITPPRGVNLDRVLEQARLCRDRGIDCINLPDGPRASARVSPLVTAIRILQETGIEPVLHYCCRDRNLIGMQSDLLGGYVAGIRNLLIITGDPPKLGDYPDATGVFDVDSVGLLRVARDLNDGRDIGGNRIDPPLSLFLGAGANPCAVAPDREAERYARKIEAGAEFAITQPVFDPDALFRFLDRVEGQGPAIPVIAGVWPLISYKNAEFMRNEVPGVTVPDAILERMSRAATREDGVKTGIEIAREICGRIAERVAGFQVSAPMGRVDWALAVLDR
jgi:homocysteine S-methyltransferase